MKYKVLQRLSYNGRIYNKDENINVLDMYVESLLKRGLIEEIKGNKETKEAKEAVKEEVKEPVKETVKETPQLTEAELSKLNKDKLIELATSKGIIVDEELTKKEIVALILGD